MISTKKSLQTKPLNHNQLQEKYEKKKKKEPTILLLHLLHTVWEILVILSHWKAIIQPQLRGQGEDKRGNSSFYGICPTKTNTEAASRAIHHPF